MQRIPYVIVTILVGLDSDSPATRVDWWNKAALANLIDHPAIREPHMDHLGELRQAWRSEIYPAEADSMNLHRIRNNLGPTWLVRFRLPKGDNL